MILQQARRLQVTRHNADACPPNPDEIGEDLLRRDTVIGWTHVMGCQQTPDIALFHRVAGITGIQQCDLLDETMDISAEQGEKGRQPVDFILKGSHGHSIRLTRHMRDGASNGVPDSQHRGDADDPLITLCGGFYADTVLLNML